MDKQEKSEENDDKTVETVKPSSNTLLKHEVNECDILEKLKHLECPFTWKMDALVTVDTDYKPHDEEQDIPFLKLMRILMIIYNETKNEKKSALEYFDTVEEIVKLPVNKDDEISWKTVRHVVDATKCHALNAFGKIEEAKNILNTVSDTENLDIGTLNGCKGSAFSIFHFGGKEEALSHIRIALEHNPKCAVWNFILGKNLRRKRRDMSVAFRPSEDEKNAFLKAYKNSHSLELAIFVAQMYRESKDENKALNLYNTIFESSDVLSDSLYLRLALGFIQLRSFDNADLCLKIVEPRCANDSIFLHYKGIYYSKTRQPQIAVKYLLRAAELGFVPAALQYSRCMFKINRNFNLTNYLSGLVERCEKMPDEHRQEVFMHLALSYFSKDRDVEKSLKYFVQAIEINPKSKRLISIYSLIPPGAAIGFFKKVQREVIPQVKALHRKSDKTEELMNKLINLCEAHFKDNMENTENMMQGLLM